MLTIIRLHVECKSHNSGLPFLELLAFENVTNTIQVCQAYTLVTYK